MRDENVGFFMGENNAPGREDYLRCTQSVGMFDTVNSHISYLSEVFVEWYMLSHPRDIKDFLEKENLNGVFTEQQFEKLVLGKAYLDELLLQFVVESLPFRILPEKLSVLNRFVKKANKAAEEISAPNILPEKLSEICKSKKERAAAKKHQDYEKNKPEILARRRACYLENPELFLARSERYRKQNPEKVAAYRHHYYVTHEKGKPVSPKRKAYQLNYYNKNYDKISERARQRYQDNKEVFQQYYQDNYQKFAEYRVEYRAENHEKCVAACKRCREKHSFAKKQCVVLSFLWAMRKQETQKAKSYKDWFKVLSKRCMAIKERNIQLCGLAQSGEPEQCPWTINLNMPGLKAYIEQYLKNSCQK